MTITTSSSFKALRFTVFITLSKSSFTLPLPFQKSCIVVKNSNVSSSSSRYFSSSFLPLSMKSNLLSVSECIQRHQSTSPPIFIDGSWHLLSSRNARQEFESGPRIPGAHFFDIDNVATTTTTTTTTTTHDKQPIKLPHMMPPKEMFAHVMDEFGISPDTEVVLYGTQGCFSIPRVLYTFKAMGHPPERVWMMNGSLKDWIDAGGPVEKGYKETMTVDSCLFQKIGGGGGAGAGAGGGAGARPKYDKAVDARNVVGMDKILELVQGGEAAAAGAGGIIVDARSAGRFVGKEPEPRKGLRGGHMPGAFNVPFDTLLNDEKNKLRSREEMISIFENAGVDVNTEKDIICSCGSGVTACWIALALEECGRDPTKTFLYDGSWIEWASDESNPVVKED